MKALTTLCVAVIAASVSGCSNKMTEIEQLSVACNENKQGGCEKLTAHHKPRCNSGDAGSCYVYGNLIHRGKAPGTPTDTKKCVKQAAPIYEKACSGGRHDGCSMLATLHYMGFGLAKDAAKAVHFAEKACKLGKKPKDCKQAKEFGGSG